MRLSLFTILVAITCSHAWTFNYGSKSVPHKYEGKTIAEVLRQNDRFSKLMSAFEKHSNLRDDLDSTEKKLVLFAPTNEAFEDLSKMPKGEVDMEDLLNYHMVSHEKEIADRENWYNGMLIESRLRESKLGDKNQVIRMSRMFGRWSLNLYAQIEELEMEASNGVIFVLDRVLLPPLNLLSMTRMLPFELSTWNSAIMSCKEMTKKLEDGNELTLYVPSNRAWKKLGVKNLVYLFSDMGRKDLFKVLKYHVGVQLKYTPDLKETDTIKSLLGEAIDLKIIERGKKSRTRRGRSIKEERRHVMLDDWARVILKDLPAENGVLNVVDEVLIPKDVELPEEPFYQDSE